MRALRDPHFYGLIRKYLTVYLPKQKCVSPNTIRAYQNALESILDYIVEHKNMKLSEISFETITASLVYDFLEWLVTCKGCSISTRNHRLQCIRSFYGYVADTDPSAAVFANEIFKVQSMPNTASHQIDYMSEPAIAAILSEPDRATARGIRDVVLMTLLYDTGARIQEILNLRLSDVCLHDSRITLLGKGQKIRLVTLMNSTKEHLLNYLSVYHPGSPPDRPLFYTTRNGLRRSMTSDNARKLIKAYGTLARRNCVEVPENVHPHMFRHSRAMHLYQHGMPLLLVSQWLGHANVETTLIYAHADTEMKRKAIEASTPETSPLKSFSNSERFTISDEDLIKKLYGIRK